MNEHLPRSKSLIFGSVPSLLDTFYVDNVINNNFEMLQDEKLVRKIKSETSIILESGDTFDIDEGLLANSMCHVNIDSRIKGNNEFLEIISHSFREIENGRPSDVIKKIYKKQGFLVFLILCACLLSIVLPCLIASCLLSEHDLFIYLYYI
eukprot:Awhi_evm1s203